MKMHLMKHFRKIPIEAVSFTTGSALASISAHELFFNKVRTTAQVTIVAIPIFILLSRGATAVYALLPPRKVLKRQNLIAPYLFGALFVLAANRILTEHPSSMCDYYNTCPNAQAHFAKECRQLHYQCEEELMNAEWHLGTRYIAHSYGGDVYYHGGWGGALAGRERVNWCADGSEREFQFETRKEAVEKLCRRIFEKEKVYKRREDNDSICFRLNHKDLEKVNHIKQNLHDITDCLPDFHQNAYYNIVSKVNVVMISMLVVLAGTYLFILLRSTPNRDEAFG